MFPKMVDLQKSFIPLYYSLANSPQSTTKLRICTNSSFKSNGKSVSVNDCMISGPEYLNSLDSILTRWRTATRTAHSDISKCYHRISTSDADNSLRRLWVKPVLGSNSEWEEYCFSKCSFGDILGGCVASAAIEDASKRFMNKEAQDALIHTIYIWMTSF